MIEFQGVAAGYGREDVLHDVTFTVPDGSVTTLVGPNGCGKTTLLRAAAGQLPLRSGSILLDGRPLNRYDRKSLARTAAFMPQLRSVPAITVEALVSHGRFPYLGFSRRLSAGDREAVRRAMDETGVSAWSGRDLRELSGGERQRVYIAMALAQDTRVIFLDEPTTYLDPGRQFELLELIASLNQRGKTVVMVLHDLAHALRYSSQLLLLEGGRTVLCASPEAMLKSGCLEQVFGIRIHRAGEGYYFTPGAAERQDHA